MSIWPLKLTTGKRIAENLLQGESGEVAGGWPLVQAGICSATRAWPETVASRLLEQTNLRELGFSFVPYRMEQLEVHRAQANRLLQPGLSREGEAIPHPSGAIPQRGRAGLASPSLPPAQPCQPGAVDGRHHPAAHRPLTGLENTSLLCSRRICSLAMKTGT